VGRRCANRCGTSGDSGGITAPPEGAQQAHRLGASAARKADYRALGAAAPKGDILGVRVPDEGVTFALIADDPAVYFTPAALRRLSGGSGEAGPIGIVDLKELIIDAWLTQAPKKLAKSFLEGTG
jgi:hypothetical protein